MSEKIQRNAKARRDSAREREENARERADKNRGRGEKMLAERHDAAASSQAQTAGRADATLRADKAVEGDQL